MGSARIQAQASGFTGQSGLKTVVKGAVAQLRVETAADGSGTVLPAQDALAGSSITGYAITRDAQGNFVANPNATWSLVNVTGGVVSGDLVKVGTAGKSAIFTAHKTGTANIQATASSRDGQSGLLRVIAGAATQVRVETAPDGSGAVLGAQNIRTSRSITTYAVTRDAQGNFVANSSATWSLVNILGGVVSGDLMGSGASAVFTAHTAGSASISATIGSLTKTDSGKLTVIPNANPVANADSATRSAGASLKITIASLLANDADADGDTISFAGLPSSTSRGGATLTVGATYVFYLPGLAGDGDTFHYTISDGYGGTATGTVTVHVLSATSGSPSGSISVSAGSATVKLFGIPGLSYNVERSTDLSVWTPLTTSVPPPPFMAAPDGSFSFTDTFGVPAPASVFYRTIYHP